MHIIRRNKFLKFFLLLLIYFILILSIKNKKIILNNDINKTKKNLKENNVEQIINKNTQKRNNALLKGKDYINKCIKGLLFNKKSVKKYNNSIISAIIPVFNCGKKIISSIRSIQNQNISQIEIILINDFSQDNSLIIIEELQKQDSRIKIINNKKNMGTLYSRCIGVLCAKGKYIFPLDNDEMFLDYDVFDYIYKIGINENFDIVGFKTVYIKDYNDSIDKIKDIRFSNHPNNMILHQPNLRKYPITRDKMYNDIHIWGKSIKNEIYKKGVKYLGKKRYSIFMSWAEDTIMILILFNIAKSFKFVHKYGVIHLLSNSTASFTQPLKNRIYGEILLLDIIFDYSKNNSDKNLAVYHALYIKKKYNITKYENNKNLIKLRLILKKIINCKYINKINKLKILNNFEDFNIV